MSRSQSDGAAVFPAALTLRVEADGAVIGNRGDVVIESNLAATLGPIKRVFSEAGSVRIATPEFTAESVQAEAGEVQLSGAVQVQHLKARAVRFTEGSLKVKVVQASDEAALSGSAIEAEVVVAPKVIFGGGITGRATAVGAGNDLGAHKVRGCFSLTEYVDMFPHGRQTLERYGIVPGDVPPAAAAADGGVPDRSARAKAAPPPAEEEDDDEGEPAPSAGNGAADIPHSAVSPALAGNLALEQQVKDSLKRVVEVYANEDVPPPILFLDALVEEERFDELKLQLNGIWRDLLKYHQKKGLRIASTVTQQFQAIQLVMKKMP